MTRLLVVDDSPLMRRLIGAAFEAVGGFEVSFARDGVEALDQIRRTRPDVVTLDVEMPGLDGLACLDRIMVEAPCRVVMVSSRTSAGAETTLQALELGAVDFVEKPKGPASLAMDAFAPVLVETVRAAAGARLRPTLRLAERVRRRVSSVGAVQPRARARPAAAATTATATVFSAPARAPRGADAPAAGLVLVGCSTGGPPALEALLSSLPGDLAWPVLVAQHMPASFTGALARRLDRLCALQVSEVDAPTELLAGSAYIARGDADVLVSRRGERLIGLPAPPSPQSRWRPCVDRMVDSARSILPATRLLGVLMTGMGDDGAAALARLHAEGGATLAEAEESAVVWGMPGALVRLGGAAEVAPLEALAAAVLRRVGRL